MRIWTSYETTIAAENKEKPADDSETTTNGDVNKSDTASEKPPATSHNLLAVPQREHDLNHCHSD